VDPDVSFPDPLSPWISGFSGVREIEEMHRGMWVAATTPRPPVATTPHAVVHRQDKLKVRFYPPKIHEGRAPVVVVPSLINRAWILDLEPGRSLVEALSEKGHPTYLVDWGVLGPEDAHEDVGYVLLELLHRSIERISRHARRERVLLLGYCMGGTLAAMYAALRPRRIEGFVALNAPVKFSHGGRFSELVDPQVFDVLKSIPADRLVSAALLGAAFRMLAPMGNLTKYRGINAATGDPKRLHSVLARERWLEENVPMSGAFAREFLLKAYQEDALIRGQWVVRGERIQLKKITCPTLIIVCERDTIAPPESVRPLSSAVGAERVDVEELPTGHIGVVVGSQGPLRFYPLLDHWFRSVSP